MNAALGEITEDDLSNLERSLQILTNVSVNLGLGVPRFAAATERLLTGPEGPSAPNAGKGYEHRPYLRALLQEQSKERMRHSTSFRKSGFSGVLISGR
jgi:hypothetical protein